MAHNYDVGYRRPPKHTRFKKGRSGNPKGRPKDRKNMRTIVNDVLGRTVTITENGRTRQVMFLEAFVHQLAAKALSGSTRDQIMLLKAINDYAPELMKEADLPLLITTRYVLPDGKTMESYDRSDAGLVASSNDRKTSPAHPQPNRSGDENDSWLD